MLLAELNDLVVPVLTMGLTVGGDKAKGIALTPVEEEELMGSALVVWFRAVVSVVDKGS